LERRNLQHQLQECKEALQRLEEELINNRPRDNPSGKVNELSTQIAYDMNNLKRTITFFLFLILFY